MRLASYTAMMAVITATGVALMAFGGEPLPRGWLDGVVAPGSTIGAAAAVLGLWGVGVGTTVLGGAMLARLAWEVWRHWRGERRTRGQPAAR
ncbi:hypothetical protein [Belnapia rosea]|uniref:Uncharacterized protein n=1 Tax=Belnapia rosea TaxID=938405 RepID=A0A1G6V5K5_9PROT|nr:hypothetical protein [Belnapia rosea]SDD48317.1 hypothetical protein SAMN04487779_1008121 [Belnapia rosea]